MRLGSRGGGGGGGGGGCDLETGEQHCVCTEYETALGRVPFPSWDRQGVLSPGMEMTERTLLAAWAAHRYTLRKEENCVFTTH